MQDDPHYDEKVDIYSTGLIMWYIALGERPFDRVPAEVRAITYTSVHTYTNACAHVQVSNTEIHAIAKAQQRSRHVCFFCSPQT
jgi:hypothetical protein